MPDLAERQRAALRPNVRALITAIDAAIAKYDVSCDSCDASGVRLRCMGCRNAIYCSRDCQRHAWTREGHKQDCKDMRDVLLALKI